MSDHPRTYGPAYTDSQVRALTGITYRQLDYWTRTGRVTASRHVTSGHGDPRLYSSDDVMRIAVLARMLDAGLSLAAADRHISTVLAEGTVALGRQVSLTVDVEQLRAAFTRLRAS